MLFYGNLPGTVFIALFYEHAGLHKSARSFSSLRKLTLVSFWRAKRGVAKIAARFARLLPYLTTNPAAAYASRGYMLGAFCEMIRFINCVAQFVNSQNALQFIKKEMRR